MITSKYQFNIETWKIGLISDEKGREYKSQQESVEGGRTVDSQGDEEVANCFHKPVESMLLFFLPRRGE